MWDTHEKGFVFIGPDEGSEDLFCHRSSLQGGAKGLRKGDSVRFDTEYDDDDDDDDDDGGGDGDGAGDGDADADAADADQHGTRSPQIYIYKLPIDRSSGC